MRRRLRSDGAGILAQVLGGRIKKGLIGAGKGESLRDAETFVTAICRDKLYLDAGPVYPGGTGRLDIAPGQAARQIVVDGVAAFERP